MTDELDRVAESFAEAWAYGFDEEADRLASQAFAMYRDRHPEQDGPDVPWWIHFEGLAPR